MIAAIDRAESLRREAALYDLRAAGADQKAFADYVRKMTRGR